MKTVTLSNDDLADLKTLRDQVERQANAARKKVSDLGNKYQRTGGPYFDETVREPERLLVTLNKILK
jgi:hypothetical protein